MPIRTRTAPVNATRTANHEGRLSGRCGGKRSQVREVADLPEVRSAGVVFGRHLRSRDRCLQVGVDAEPLAGDRSGVSGRRAHSLLPVQHDAERWTPKGERELRRRPDAPFRRNAQPSGCALTQASTACSSTSSDRSSVLKKALFASSFMQLAPAKKARLSHGPMAEASRRRA